MTPKFIAPADPATRWTAAHRGPAFFAYSTNYLIDIDNAVIVDVEATTAIRQAEILAAKRMIERSMERFDLAIRVFGTSVHLVVVCRWQLLGPYDDEFREEVLDEVGLSAHRQVPCD